MYIYIPTDVELVLYCTQHAIIDTHKEIDALLERNCL